MDNRELPSVDYAHGCLIKANGKEFIDSTAGGTSYAILGWNSPEINNAITQQLMKYAHMDYKLWQDPNIDALAKLVTMQAPSPLSRVYFAGNSGAEACEAAMKMSFQTHAIEGNHAKKWFISRKQSYHGSTSDALALGDRPNLEFYRPMLSPYRVHVDMHHFNKLSIAGETEEDYSSRCAKQLEDKILEIGPENVAAFVGETIMGGLVGDVPPVGNYWRKISSVCKKYNVHLILDEVYCGTGTSGTYFCYEQDNFEPDLVFMGKTLAAGYGALSVVASTERIYETIKKSADNRLQHTTTHQAHSLSVAAALEVQKTIAEPNFLAEVRRKGELFRKLFSQALEASSRIVDIRGRGLRFSIEHNIENQVEFGRKMEISCAENYQVLVNAKWHRICFTPPLIISDREIEKVVEATSQSFLKLSKNFK